MKRIILVLFLVLTASADEIQRMEAIVADIVKLRTSYEQCEERLKSQKMNSINAEISTSIEKHNEVLVECKQEEDNLNKYKLLLQEEKGRTAVLAKKSDSYDALANEKNSLYTKIMELEEKLEKEKKLSKIKDNKIISLEKLYKDRNIKKIKTKEKITLNLENVSKNIIFEGDNPFPELMMKKKYQKEIIKENIITFNASSFRLKNDADIYDFPNKNIVDRWGKNRSFTSNKKTLKWINITGIFVDKKWVKVTNSIWIKKNDTIKR